MSSELWRLVGTLVLACVAMAVFTAVVLEPSLRRGISRRRLMATGLIAGVISTAAAFGAVLLIAVDLIAMGVTVAFAAVIVGVMLAKLGRMRRGLATAMSPGLLVAAMFALIIFGLITGGLRTYLVPTGAMAPVIKGVHESTSCTACGYVLNIADGALTDHYADCYHCGATVTLNGSSITRHSGDRLIAITHRAPRRWDLVTFLNPKRPDEMYVKRLVGMPGETVQILDGDLFINGMREVKRPGEQESMWVLVHDTQLVRTQPSTGMRGWHPMLDPAEAASTDKTIYGWWWLSGDWRGSGGEKEQTIEFRGDITVDVPYILMSGSSAKPFVHDVRLRCSLESLSGGGLLTLRWKCRDREVAASFAGNGDITLTGGVEAASVTVQKPGLLAGGECGLIVRDGLAHATVDGEVAATMDVLPAEVHAAGDWAQGDGRTQVSISVRDGTVDLKRILLERDVHYTSDIKESAHAVDRPFDLSPQEFFGLGDNSASSADSRFYGAVPVSNYRQIVLGRYLPPDRAGPLW